MLPLDDPRWKTYKGGYRTPYDASISLRRLLDNGPAPDIWEEFWLELHHQGDVDAASYAAVPYLVESIRRSDRMNWNPLGLVAVIELERPHNPPPPPEIAEGYFRAIEELPALLAHHPQRDWEDRVTAAAVSCIALARGQRLLARVYLELNLENARPWLQEELGIDLSDMDHG